MRCFSNGLLVLFSAAVMSMTCVATSASAAPGAKAPLVKVESREIGHGNVLAGLDVLEAEGFQSLKGKRLGLLTNMSSIDRKGRHILDLMLGTPSIKLVALFSPEHGLYGTQDTLVADSRDTATGLMVHSLYQRHPGTNIKTGHANPDDLKGLDAVVIDLQDVGARYYTYITYMAYMMEDCAKAGVGVIVLDRPNPIGGNYVDGPIQDFDKRDELTAYFPMPIAHGMTMGELAQMFNKENHIDCNLTVVRMKNWTRDMYFDQTGLRWVNPSPNIQDLDAALVYPGIAITEALISMGRGTPQPFHVFGSPMITDPQALIDHVLKLGVKGVKLEPVTFTPTGVMSKDHPGEGRECHGARITITDRKQFRAYELGQAVIDYMQATYGDESTTNSRGKLVPKYNIWAIRNAASSWVCARTVERKPFADTMKLVDEQVAAFKKMRAKYLIYK